jgi:nucleotide-binding universal stress UspA family protein
MSSNSLKKTVNRILVAVDASPQSLAALRVATDLAARLEAELIGIFVEDINLVHTAGLPFAHQISIETGALRRLDSSNIERQLRAQARWVQKNIAVLAERSSIRWSFQVVRGKISAQLLAAAVDADLTILGKTGWSGRRWLGSTAQRLVIQLPCTSLILQRVVHFKHPVILVYDGSEAGQKALTSVNLIASHDSPVLVIILADDAEEAGKLRQDIDTWFEKQDLKPHYRWLKKLNSTILANLTRAEGCGVLILPTKIERLSEKTILNTLNQSECAVLLVR